MSFRPVKTTSLAQPTMEGAGVHLHRAFGFGDPDLCDPFLMLDDFRNDVPEHYAQGFPWHPHRGIETITYVLEGEVEHSDSLGNSGVLGAGSVQWMTAGSGILHQEMPRGNAKGQMHGFQLWANLPSSLKMTAPRYQDIQAGSTSPRSLMMTARGCASSWVSSGASAGPSMASPQIRCYAWISPCRRTPRRAAPSITYARTLPTSSPVRALSAMPPTRLACGWKRSSQGEELNIRDLSGNRTLVHFDTGDEVCRPLGRPGRHALPAGLRQPIKRTGRLAWPDCDEHPRRADAGHQRTQQRHLHQAGALIRFHFLTDLGAGAEAKSTSG
jgi:hypothetical protein